MIFVMCARLACIPYLVVVECVLSPNCQQDVLRLFGQIHVRDTLSFSKWCYPFPLCFTLVKSIYNACVVGDQWSETKNKISRQCKLAQRLNKCRFCSYLIQVLSLRCIRPTHRLDYRYRRFRRSVTQAISV